MARAAAGEAVPRLRGRGLRDRGCALLREAVTRCRGRRVGRRRSRTGGRRGGAGLRESVAALRGGARGRNAGLREPVTALRYGSRSLRRRRNRVLGGGRVHRRGRLRRAGGNGRAGGGPRRCRGLGGGRLEGLARLGGGGGRGLLERPAGCGGRCRGLERLARCRCGRMRLGRDRRRSGVGRRGFGGRRPLRGGGGCRRLIGGRQRRQPTLGQRRRSPRGGSVLNGISRVGYGFGFYVLGLCVLGLYVVGRGVVRLRVMELRVLRLNVLSFGILGLGVRRVGPRGHVVVGRVDRIVVGCGVQFHNVCDVRGFRGNRLVGRITRVGGSHLGFGLDLGFFVRVYVVAGAVLRVRREGLLGLGLCFGLGLRFGLDRRGDHDLRLDHNLSRSRYRIRRRRRTSPLREFTLQSDRRDPHCGATLKIPVLGVGVRLAPTLAGRSDDRRSRNGGRRRRPLCLKPTRGEVRQSRRPTGTRPRQRGGRTRLHRRGLGLGLALGLGLRLRGLLVRTLRAPEAPDPPTRSACTRPAARSR